MENNMKKFVNKPKYNMKQFKQAVNYYKKYLHKYEKKSIYLVFNPEKKESFFSLAPLSRAAHDLKIDLYISSKHDENVEKVWRTFEAIKTKNKTLYKKNTIEASRYLRKIILTVSRKIKNTKFQRLFKKPDLIIESDKKGFVFYETQKRKNIKKKTMLFKDKWFKKYHPNLLRRTCKNVLNNVFNLKKDERFSIGFELVPSVKHLQLPLEDYLDSYAITYEMYKQSKKNVKKVFMKSSTSRISMNKLANPISDLKTTLLGLELSKNMNEEVFKDYKEMAKFLNLKINFSDAVFAISGQGYGGRHIFGEVIGYPTSNNESRWSSPGEMLYQFPWFAQTADEKRDPKSRIGFTETLPIDVFIKSSNVDYKKMRARNKKIMDVVNECDYITVEGKEIDGYRTALNIALGGNKGRRLFRPSDSDARHKIDPNVLKKTGNKCGMMANIPGGEAFVTPEFIQGTFVGDVVVSVDQSYIIPESRPLIVKCNEKGYAIVDGDKRIIDKIEKKKKEAWKNLLRMEKYNSLPQKIIDLKKKNFGKIGEFAINTNPSAMLCDYLIVNEKIADMIHIALGSGFDHDRNSVYHMDIVINSPKQKLTIKAITGKKEKTLIKRGKFVI